MNVIDRIKLFQFSTQLAERELDRIETELNLDLGREKSDQKDEDFYPQIDYSIRREAASMAEFYEIFYSLERSIRQIIIETLSGKFGEKWWDRDQVVPEQIRVDVRLNMQRELDAAVASRSNDEIDYTTFGQLGDIVRHRWDDFNIFNSKKGFNKVMNNLNVLRGPIAHCSPLPKSEQVRLISTVEDWFRLMN